MFTQLGRPIVFLLGVVFSPLAVAAAEFRPLGMTNTAPYYQSHAYGISADGRFAVGDLTPLGLEDLNAVRNHFGESGQGIVGDLDFDGTVGLLDLNFARNNLMSFDCPDDADCGIPSAPFRIGAEAGLVSILQAPFGRARDVSANGGVVVGSGAGPTGSDAFRWTPTDGVRRLGALVDGESHSIASGVSADGLVVVGGATSTFGREAFRWTETSGMVGLGDLPGGEFGSRAEAASRDGRVIVGQAWSDGERPSEAFRWTAENGMVGLGYLPDLDPYSDARGISDDGRVIVGVSGAVTGQRAVRWTETSGPEKLLSADGSDIESMAMDASADGAIIVGLARWNERSSAMIWNAELGMRNLQETLMNEFGLGSQLSGWHLSSATSVSADGLTIVGDGEDPLGREHGWLVRLHTGVFATTSVPEPSTISLLTVVTAGMIASRFARKPRFRA